MYGGGLTQPSDLPRLTPSVMAQAVVRAAGMTGELSLLSFRDEQVLKGYAAFKGRWVAFAALAALYPQTPHSRIGLALGCGPDALASLAFTRRTVWWDEAMVVRLFQDLAGAPDARAMTGLEGLTRTVADILGGLMDTHTEEAGREPA